MKIIQLHHDGVLFVGKVVEFLHGLVLGGGHLPQLIGCLPDDGIAIGDGFFSERSAFCKKVCRDRIRLQGVHSPSAMAK